MIDRNVVFTESESHAGTSRAVAIRFYISDWSLSLANWTLSVAEGNGRREGGDVCNSLSDSSSEIKFYPLFPYVGSRRPSLTSVHSSTSSARSYSARRLEKERSEKEQRQALQELRLAKQREQQQQQQQQIAPTPSPRTPHSMDELLPSVEEGKEVFYNEVFRGKSSACSIRSVPLWY